MDCPTLTIERGSGRRRGGKSRSFSVRLLAHLEADSLWEGPRSGRSLRPVWIAYFGTEQESAPFTANFRAGRKAASRHDRFEIARKAPYRWRSHKVPGGVVTVAYLPELFQLEPATPFVEEVRFVLLPPVWWLEREAGELAADFDGDAWEAAWAALFCAFLDRRTPLPILSDLRFHLELYRAALETDWVHPVWQTGAFRGEGLSNLGLDGALAVDVSQEALGELLVGQTSEFLRKEAHRGPTRIAADRRLLPDPNEPLDQLCLDFALA